MRRNLSRGLQVVLSLLITASVLFTGKPMNVEAASGFTSADFLKTNGTTIRKSYGSGDVVYLRGTNAGGWLVQEEWMNPTNAGDQRTMMDTLANRFGTSVRDELVAVYEDNYWTTQDFDNCAAMGMSVIRLPFTYMNLCNDDGSLKANAWNRLDWFVNNCSQRGIYVILDMHGAFGSQNGMDHSGEVNDGYQLYWNDSNKNKTLQLWSWIAEHFNGNPAVAAYDILNEPGIKAAATNGVQWDFYNQIYQTIRAKDTDHILIMESCWDANDLPSPSTYGWSNVAYEYHYYPWDHINSTSGQASYVQSKVQDIASHNYGVPTFVGEFTCFGLEDAWRNTMTTYNNQGWHWTTWTYKVTGDSSWGIYNHKPSAVDIYNDSAATIRQKWSTVGTNNGYANSMIYNVIKSCLPGTVAFGNSGSSTGSTVANLSNGTYYVTSVANSKVVCADNTGADPLKANRDAYGGAWESLELVNNGDGTVSFKSGANNKYVCAVIDDDSQLLARSDSIGTWEKFNLYKITNNEYAIQAVANGKYVQANLNADGKLVATSDSVAGAWESFNISLVGGSSSGTTTETPAAPTNTIADGNYYFTASANGSVVCAENGGADPLVANRSSYGGAWESITIINNSDGTISLKSGANDKYICAVIDESNQLLPRSVAIGDWEKFNVEKMSDGTYALKAVANGKYVQANLNENGKLVAASDSVAGAWETFSITFIN